MAANNLYNSASKARKALVIVLMLALVIVFWTTFVNFSQQIRINPVTTVRYYMEADSALGIVPKPSINSISIDKNQTPSFSIDNVFDDTSFPDVAFVYQINQPKEKLTTVEDAQVTAQTLGFVNYTNLTQDDLQWIDLTRTKTLNFNKVNQVWKMTTNYNANIEAKKNKNLSTDPSSYNSLASTITTSLGFGNSYNLSNGSVSVVFTAIGPDGGFYKPDNDTTAQYVFMNVYRKLSLAVLNAKQPAPLTSSATILPQNLNGIVYTTDPRNGEFRAVVSNTGSDLKKDIFEFNFTNFEYTINNGVISQGSYYIITPEEAWTRAQNANGSLTSLIPENANPVGAFPQNLGVKQFVADASKTEIGYYEPEVWTGFVYPIYIFKGRAQLSDGRQASFKIYVDAIKRLN